MTTTEFSRLLRDFRWCVDDYLAQDAATGVWFSARTDAEKSVYVDAQWSELDDKLDGSWWTTVRNWVISDALQRCDVRGVLWDLGGGTGFVTRYLNDCGFVTMNVEPSRFGAVRSAERGVPTICSSLSDLNLPNNCVSAVTMFDVLEHLSNRREVLSEIHRVMMPGGLLILTVPALRLLWSQHDVELGHCLRFSRGSIRKELRENGYEVVRSGYFFLLTILPLLLIRALPFRLGIRKSTSDDSTLSAHGGVVGELAGWFERRVALRVPIGSSLLVIARKHTSSN